ncbi:MAG TPA: CBS domain-containing protein [Methanolinea sp.]|jgi:CBS domain-containing protein|nr:CBS domain-containing protein [Methanolinea sp.]MDI6899863.1 CBS domain-containing protein [Methanolinea sp.]HOS82416.1 CBS domain-containing protein [Methanolinea sp.]HPC55300.1 CBS domain-containing protein [Methanolinea sp.]HQE86094.1 CBS domain-containing protein [Methanolinea sp.]
MLVRDVMTKNPVTVSAGATIREAAALLRERNIGGLPVMDGDRLVGMITESDILRLLETGRISDDLWLPSPLEVIEVPIREFINWEKTRHALTAIGEKEVRTVMSHPVVTIGEDADIEEAASLMLSKKIARLPVMRGNTLVGIVARSDIIRGIARTET